METVQQFFASAPLMAWSMVSVLMSMVTMAVFWPQVSWWWINTWYSFPVIGKIARLSGDVNRDLNNVGWTKSETTLCRDFKKFIRTQDERDFDEKCKYLNKAGDIGRKGTPPAIWLLTIALVFVESLGFSYVLAGYTIPGASENVQQYGALGIAFLLSVVFVVLTHIGGHQLYKGLKIKHARQEWIEAGRQGKFFDANIPLGRKDTPQSTDDHRPNYVQLTNRVGNNYSFFMLYAAVFFTVLVAIGATYVRTQVLEKQLHQQITAHTNADFSGTSGADGLDLGLSAAANAIVLPAEDAAANRKAEQKALADEVNIDRHGGWGTFIVLAVIFVFLQILSVFFGYNWGFAGKQSADAFKSIGNGKYLTYADALQYYQEIADVAQAKLENLQQKMMEKNSNSGNQGLHTSKTFYDFMGEERQKESKKSSTAPVHVIQINETVPLDTSHNLSDVMQKLLTMGDDKEQRKAFVQSLPEQLQDHVVQALKDEVSRKASTRSQELDNLL